MTTTTISAAHRSHSLTALLHDAFHVRARLTAYEVGDESPDTAVAVKRPRQGREDQATMLVTFAGRYGARY